MFVGSAKSMHSHGAVICYHSVDVMIDSESLNILCAQAYQASEAPEGQFVLAVFIYDGPKNVKRSLRSYIFFRIGCVVPMCWCSIQAEAPKA